MTEHAVQETAVLDTDLPDTVATDSAEPTLASVMRDNADEVVEELDGLDIETVESAERPKLMAFADRMLKRLAADEAEVTEVTAAMKAEVLRVTQGYEALAQKASKRASWKRFILERVAMILFPDAKAKSKSINLPYGSLGRKDYKAAPELVDENLAIARALVLNSRGLVKLTISTTVEDLEDFLINAFRHVEGQKDKATLTATVRNFVDGLLVEAQTSEAPQLQPLVVKPSLKWGDLKKQESVSLWTQERDGFSGGVRMADPRTTFNCEVTEG
jgi:hypothetical protein